MLAPILTLLVLLLPARAAQWPEWSLPAPLPRPDRQDLVYPAWFAGRWQVSSGAISFEARFCQQPDPGQLPQPGKSELGKPEAVGKPGGGQPEVVGKQELGKRAVVGKPGLGERPVVGDRAFNALGIGKAVLGDQLLSVRSDPANPNRQISQLRGSRQLESQVVGRRSEIPAITGASTAAGVSTADSTPNSTAGSTAPEFWADELSLQVLHGPGEPRLSRVETLSHFALQADGSILGEQWQASYPSPSLGLAARPMGTNHELLRLEPISFDPIRLDPPGRQSDPAS